MNFHIRVILDTLKKEQNYEKKYHKLTEEEKEEIIKERRRKLGKRI